MQLELFTVFNGEYIYHNKFFIENLEEAYELKKSLKLLGI